MPSRRPFRPVHEPWRMDPRLPAVIGTLVWTALLGIALSRQGSLIDAGREWWIWTALAGVALGLAGIGWATWLTRRRQRRDATSAEPSPASSDRSAPG